MPHLPATPITKEIHLKLKCATLSPPPSSTLILHSFLNLIVPSPTPTLEESNVTEPNLSTNSTLQATVGRGQDGYQSTAFGYYVLIPDLPNARA